MRRNHNLAKLAIAHKHIGGQSRDMVRTAIKALSLHSWNNTPEESERLDSMIYANRFWREFENMRGRIRAGRSIDHADNHIRL